MLSRVAENLYWISRYVERAENLARLLENAFYMELDATVTTATGPRPLERVLIILNSREAFLKYSALAPTHAEQREAILRFLTFARQETYSIRSMIARARENARAAQDALGSEVWSQLNQFYLYLSSAKADSNFQSSALRFYTRVKRECILVSALIDGVLPRSEAFHFLQLGRYLERIDLLSRILSRYRRSLVPLTLTGMVEVAPGAVEADGTPNGKWASESSFTPLSLVSLLRSCSAYEACLQQSQARLEPERVARYLLLEMEFPRSIRFSVARCLESLRFIAGETPLHGSEAERYLGRLDSELRYITIEELFSRGLPHFLEELQNLCNQVNREIHQTYFRT